MNKIEFKAELKKNLEKNKSKNIDEILDYYDEIISDRIENGEKESEIIEKLKNFSEIVKEESHSESQKQSEEFINKAIPLTNKLTLKIRNAKVFIEKSLDENIHVCYYDYKLSGYTIESFPNGEIVFKNKKRNLFQLVAATLTLFETFHREPVRVFIPQNQTCEIAVEVDNGRITINDVSSKNLYAKTSNGRVVVNTVKTVQTLFLKSSNGRVICNNVETETFDSSTSNGRVIGANICADKVRLDSSNGRLDIKQLDSKNINASTSNGKVILELSGKAEETKMNIATSNGKVFINGARQGNTLINYSGERCLNATSSNGSIFLVFAE